jgi:hypothetical protein
VADQPAGELPAAVGPEDGAAVLAEDAAMDEAADHGPADAAPEGAAVVVTRHREHRFPAAAGRCRCASAKRSSPPSSWRPGGPG